MPDQTELQTPQVPDFHTSAFSKHHHKQWLVKLRHASPREAVKSAGSMHPDHPFVPSITANQDNHRRQQLPGEEPSECIEDRSPSKQINEQTRKQEHTN
jgi:hypothetical protein